VQWVQALKWLGYIVAAIAVLTVAVGVGVFLAIGAAVFCLVVVVLIVASLIKELVTSR
jgi:hypothetical protein